MWLYKLQLWVLAMIKILPMIQGVINEKQELGGAYIDSIRMLTDRNSHTRARAELARALGDKRLINAYQGLMYVEDLLRDSNDTKKARAKLDKMLFAKSKKKYSNHDIIMGVF